MAKNRHFYGFLPVFGQFSGHCNGLCLRHSLLTRSRLWRTIAILFLTDPATPAMIADEKAARQKDHEKQCVFHGFFAIFTVKTNVFEKRSKDKILRLLFCGSSEKQGLNCRLWRKTEK